MKKLSSLLVIAFFTALIFSSCKKDYTCSCTLHDSAGYFADSSYDFTINDTKSKATDACNAGDATVGTITWNCDIK